MQRAQVGNVEVVALVDNVQHYPATAVYPGVGDAVNAYKDRLDGEGRIALNFACFLLDDGGHRLLVDTGWGPEFDGKLLEELRAAGIDLASINAVLFTHLHGDHTGWNLDRATGAPLFPNARYLVPRGDWEHYRAAEPMPDSFTRDVVPLEALGRMDLIDGERSLSASLTAVATPGHTPGHTSIAIASGGELGFILGDVVISELDAINPEWPNSFETDNGIARTTRIATIDRLIEQRALVGASHLPVPGLGRFVRTAGRTGWQPL